MKVVVREAAAGDLDDILDWISSSVARMSEATSGTKRAGLGFRFAGAGLRFLL
jgi:hypothetical protein